MKINKENVIICVVVFGVIGLFVGGWELQAYLHSTSVFGAIWLKVKYTILSLCLCGIVVKIYSIFFPDKSGDAKEKDTAKGQADTQPKDTAEGQGDTQSKDADEEQKDTQPKDTDDHSKGNTYVG